MDGERGSGAALRRRERRQRAWQRHVRTAVQLALAAKLHHSANKVEPHDALRGQEKRAGREEAGLETHSGLRAPTPLPPEMRPAPLSEVAGAQRCDRTVRGTSLGAPSLAAPQLAANETLDSAALSFLLNRALEEKEKEEEERVKREEEQVKRQEDQEEERRRRPSRRGLLAGRRSRTRCTRCSTFGVSLLPSGRGRLSWFGSWTSSTPLCLLPSPRGGRGRRSGEGKPNGTR